MADIEAGEWPVNYSLADCDVFDSADGGSLKADCEQVAVNVLWNFTRRVFGTKEVVLRPMPKTMSFERPSTWRGVQSVAPNYPGWSFWQPVMLDGQWYSLRSILGDNTKQPWSLELPGPVVSVSEVKIGADVLDVAEYRLDGSYLIHKSSSWPTTQDIRADLGEEGAWSITYVKGTVVPRAGQLAAGILACELGKAAMDRTCALPERVQTITRQGITMAILDTFEDLEKGRVGIPRVDLWIASVNKERHAATVARSVDLPRAVR